MTQPKGLWRQLPLLATVGALGFWFANLAISRTSMAAEYRAALSIEYAPMLLEALFGGLILGVCVSFALLRFFDKLPMENPILKSVVLSSIALIAVTALVELPAKFLAPTPDAFRYFLIGGLFNVIRILALGVVVGYLYERLNGNARSTGLCGP
jgi:hypothetical protein